jgi:hypothetical protein
MPMEMTYLEHFRQNLKRLSIDVKSAEAYQILLDPVKQYYKYMKLKKNNQVGGSRIKKIELKFRGYPFVFFKKETKYDVMYSVHVDDDDEKSNCLFLQVEKEERSVSISEISKNSKCSSVSLPKLEEELYYWNWLYILLKII